MKDKGCGGAGGVLVDGTRVQLVGSWCVWPMGVV